MYEQCVFRTFAQHLIFLISSIKLFFLSFIFKLSLHGEHSCFYPYPNPAFTISQINLIAALNSNGINLPQSQQATSAVSASSLYYEAFPFCFTASNCKHAQTTGFVLILPAEERILIVFLSKSEGYF